MCSDFWYKNKEENTAIQPYSVVGIGHDEEGEKYWSVSQVEKFTPVSGLCINAKHQYRQPGRMAMWLTSYSI